MNRFLPRSPVLRFLLLFFVLMGIFYLIKSTSFYLDQILLPILHWNATASSWILNLFGQATTANGKILSSEVFSVSIEGGCAGIEPVAHYACAVLAFPIAFSKKYWGIVVGSAFLFFMNLARVVTLFLAGVYWTKTAFDIMHDEVWNVGFLVLSVITWMIWMQWIFKKNKTPQNVTE